MNWPGIRILVTGFGPFPGVPFNASATLVEELAEGPIRSVPQAMIYPAVLPTDWRVAAEQARELIQALKPDAILHFGVSRKCTGFEIETRARNMAGSYLDHAGQASGGRTVRRGAPPLLMATLPAAPIVQRLRRVGLPAAVSQDAGRYLCNAVLYETLLCVQSWPRKPLVSFVHIPAIPSEASVNGSGQAREAWRGLRLGTGIILKSVVPLAVAARRRRGPAGIRQVG
jgi:pyroglutamyl-peptidase